MKKCGVTGCENPHLAKGWCSTHYKRWKKSGDPLKVKQVQNHGLTVYERLLLNVSIRPDAECWEWTGGRDVNGYGRMGVGEKPLLVHRLSFEFAHGITLTPKQHVMHKCDNPSCVRPSHLSLGTHADNMADKMAKGRHVYGVSLGTKHGMSKLTESDVRAIRESSATGVALAAEYGVSTTSISDIRNRRIWRHIE